MEGTSQQKDQFSCGNCDAKFECLTDFFHHKILNTNSEKLSYCFLCQETIFGGDILADHLLKVHAISIPCFVLASQPVTDRNGESNSARCCPMKFREAKKKLPLLVYECNLKETSETRKGAMLGSKSEDSCSNTSVDVVGVPTDQDFSPFKVYKTGKRFDDAANSFCEEEGIVMDDLEPDKTYDSIYCSSAKDELLSSSKGIELMTCNSQPNTSRTFVLPQVNSCHGSQGNDFTLTADERSTVNYHKSVSLLPAGNNYSSEGGESVLGKVAFSGTASNAEQDLLKRSLQQDGKYIQHQQAMQNCDTDSADNQNVTTSSSEKSETQSDKANLSNNQDNRTIDESKDCNQKDPHEEETTNIDFHFLLGSTSIKGNSMNYQRVAFRCLHCPFTTAWKPSLVKHMKYIHKDVLEIHQIIDIRHADSGEMNTRVGNSKLKDYQVMRMSEYVAGNQKPKCQKKRTRKTEQQDIPGKYNCSVCHKAFSRLRYIRRHELTHRHERKHLCDSCGKSFKTKATLHVHRRCHKTKSYHCPQCDFVSSISAAIHRHRQLHPNGSVVCDICGSAYIDKSTLKKHRRVHDISRPFPCTYPGCTWRFKTDVTRLAHVRSHTSEGKFRCHFCGYRFRHKHHLQRHVSNIHPGGGNPKFTTSNSTSAGQELSLSHLPVTLSDEFTPQDTVNEILIPAESVHEVASKPEPATDHHSHLIDPSSNLLGAIPETPFTTSLDIQSEAMIEVLVDENKDDTFLPLTSDSEQVHSMDIEAAGGLDLDPEEAIRNTEPSAPSSLGHLEYITETGDVVQLVRPGQTYMGHDQQGNLVQYKIADVQGQEESSHPIYFIGVDGTVVGAANCQEQALFVSSKV